VVQAKRHVHSLLAKHGGDALAPHRHRRAIAQRLMKAPFVVKRDPLADSGPRLTAIAVAFEIDVLVLERPPQPLDEDIVHPPATPVHRDFDAGALQPAGEGLAGELAALVGIEDVWPAITR